MASPYDRDVSLQLVERVRCCVADKLDPVGERINSSPGARVASG